MEKICKNCKWWDKIGSLRDKPTTFYGNCDKPDMDDIVVIAVPIEDFGCIHFKEN